MSISESTQAASGFIHVPAGVREDYMTVSVWAEDPEVFDRIVVRHQAKVTDTQPMREGSAWVVQRVASWKDGPVYYSCFGPKETLPDTQRAAAQDDPRGEADR